MRVAFPTNDKSTLFKRSGRAKGFLIADISDSGFKVVDFRSNNHSHEHQHGDEGHHDHSHKEIAKALNDCQYIIVNKVGKHFGKDLLNAGIEVFKTDKQIISEAVEEFRSKNLM